MTKIILKTLALIACLSTLSCGSKSVPTDTQLVEHELTIRYKSEIDFYLDNVYIGRSPVFIGGQCGVTFGEFIVPFKAVAKGCHSGHAIYVEGGEICAQKTICNFSGKNMFLDLSDICCQI